MAEFVIAHMYPHLMNLYGDRGNLICLKQRIEWYGHQCTIKDINLGDMIDYQSVDMIFMGGGSEREQKLVYKDLLLKGNALMMQIESGLPVLCICGAYQLLGNYYQSPEGKQINGLGFFDFYTRGEKERFIGNILIECSINNRVISVVGFENHGGRTYFQDKNIQPFGKVIKGFGNNGEDKTEGIKYKKLIATYLHGPLLPKNPEISDFFIKAMAKRKQVKITGQLDDSIEYFAHEQIKRRLISN
ncbi:MAG: type 1 glutamine amidotransferase [Syntrophomonadaceae bacterium]|jgi:CobQ-like glutamine amidotransferase family enzyme